MKLMMKMVGSLILGRVSVVKSVLIYCFMWLIVEGGWLWCCLGVVLVV